MGPDCTKNDFDWAVSSERKKNKNESSNSSSDIIHVVATTCAFISDRCASLFDDKEKTFDRLGNAPTIVEFSDVEVPQTRIPVKTGRNVSVIVEAAVMNFRAKQMGFDATKTFEDRLTDLISHNKES